jgi:hypothetical protein
LTRRCFLQADFKVWLKRRRSREGGCAAFYGREEQLHGFAGGRNLVDLAFPGSVEEAYFAERGLELTVLGKSIEKDHESKRSD